MQILGRGMVARSLQRYADLHDDVIAFAGGIGNSMTVDDEPYERELHLLRTTLETCRREHKRLVYFSSGGAIYGSTEADRDEAMPLFPLTRYGKHKLICEETIRDSGTRSLIVRLANLVGTNQNSTQLIPFLTNHVQAGHVKVQRFATRDIMAVEDFASILSRLLAADVAGDTVIIASGNSVPVVDLVDAIQKAMQKTSEIEVLESGESQRFSITKLRQFLPDVAFGPDYYRTVIDKYVTCVAEENG